MLGLTLLTDFPVLWGGGLSTYGGSISLRLYVTHAQWRTSTSTPRTMLQIDLLLAHIR